VRAFLFALEAQPLKACSLIFQAIVSHYSIYSRFLGCTYLIVQANKLLTPKLRGLLIKYNSCCGPAFVNVLGFQTLIKYIFTGFDRCPRWGNNINSISSKIMQTPRLLGHLHPWHHPLGCRCRQGWAKGQGRMTQATCATCLGRGTHRQRMGVYQQKYNWT
jgi:hypothetical protein